MPKLGILFPLYANARSPFYSSRRKASFKANSCLRSSLTSQVLEQARSPACPDSYRVNGLLSPRGQLFWMHLAVFNLLGLFKVVGPYVLLIANFSHAQIQPCVLLSE